MNWRTFLLSVVLFDFLVLTIYALTEVGYSGLLLAQFETWGGIQVIIDLVIVCTLAIIWMVLDARRRGANPWPFVILTVVAGSIGPLAYLLRREWGARLTRNANVLRQA